MESFEYTTDIVFSPGEIIQDKLKELGMTQVEFAERLGMTPKNVNGIIKGKVSITLNTSIKISRVIGGSPDYWKRMEEYYIIEKARLENNDQYEQLLNSDPVQELYRRGYLQKSESVADGVDDFLRFVGYASIPALRASYDDNTISLRHSEKVKGDPLALTVWLRICENKGREMDAAEYNESKFKETLKKIRSMIENGSVDFFDDIQRMCADCGVAVVAEKEFKNGAVNGAAKWLSEEKGLIMMNIRGKYSDIFWFTFFHEAGHLLEGSKKRSHFVDLSTTDKDIEEEKADNFARNLLIPRIHYSELRTLKTAQSVKDFARKIHIHPGIVVGRLQHEHLIKNSSMNQLRSKCEWDEEKRTMVIC